MSVYVGAVYFQTLGLLFALDIEWPSAVETSLDVADTGTNVATSQWLGCIASFTERWYTHSLYLYCLSISPINDIIIHTPMM